MLRKAGEKGGVGRLDGVISVVDGDKHDESPLILLCPYYTGTVRVLQRNTHNKAKRKGGFLRLFPIHFGPHRQPQM